MQNSDLTDLLPSTLSLAAAIIRLIVGVLERRPRAQKNTH